VAPHSELVNGDSVDEKIQKERNLKYNFKLQPLETQITSLYTTVQYPTKEYTTEEIV
jgi:hypothetical protein